MSDKRPYRMSTRARMQEETRQRIVDATMQLHEEVGPRATTISAIAERAGVQRLTGYYGATRRMWAAAHRDVAEVPALQAPMAGFKAFVDTVADELTRDFRVESEQSRPIHVTIRHALGFPTWLDIEESGLDTAAKVALVAGWVEGLQGRPGRP